VSGEDAATKREFAAERAFVLDVFNNRTGSEGALLVARLKRCLPDRTVMMPSVKEVADRVFHACTFTCSRTNVASC
jgi:hypothetical protein